MDNSSDMEVIPTNPLHNKNVTYLPTPVKSANDKKEYSVIRLSNGLTALLISDVTNILTNLGSADDEMSCDESENSVSDGEDGSLGSDSDEPGEDPFSEKKSDEKLAALSLCIGVGSFSDPENVPGLAHFLEHMISMGSEKYPTENDFDTFISKRGGFSNASTECEYTSYYFDCNEVHLHAAMDKFSQFFISPLLLRDAMTREREAVDSEFQMALHSDSNRMEQILCSTAIQNNPVRKFMWGNLTSLRDNVGEDDLYTALREFWRRHYSGHRMTLALQARLPIKVMEDWVVECFSDVPCNNLPPDVFPYVDPPFKPEEFNKLITVNPIKDINKLDIVWAFPPTLHLYHSKPMDYLTSLIGHEGKGTLISYLRRKLWALDIDTGNGGSGVESNTMYSLYNISISLTEDGLKNIDEVLKLTFTYLKLLQQTGPLEHIFTELQSIHQNKFRFQEEINSADNVEHLAQSMQFYKPEEYITGGELFFEYNPEEISRILENLRPDNANIILSSRIAAKSIKLDKNEPWFNTKYNMREIPEGWLHDWKTLKPDEYFSLPEPNIYIADNFDLLPSAKDLPEYPQLIRKDEYLELWYKQDKTFLTPIGIINIFLVSPLASKSLKNQVMLELFVHIYKQLVIEVTYPATEANLSFKVKTDIKGLTIKVQGFNQKLDILLEKILSTMTSFNSNLTQETFNTIKQEVSKGYANTCLQSSTLGQELRLKLLMYPFWTSHEKYSALSSITIEDLRGFVTDFFRELYIYSLIQGNISKEKALDTVENTKKILGVTPAAQGSLLEARVCQVPPGVKFCCCEAFNKKDSNSSVTNYYQIGIIDLEEQSKLELLMMLMEEPLFDTLRTKQQLGYSVGCLVRDTYGIFGFSVTVHFQIHKHSVQHVESCISCFLESFVNVLKEMPEEEFLEGRSSLVKKKQHADMNLAEEVKRNWGEITQNWYMFDKAKREIKYIESFTQSDIYTFLEKCLQCEPEIKMRKISIQVEGLATKVQSEEEKRDELNKGDGSMSDNEDNFEEGAILDLKLKSFDHDIEKYITDTEQMKNTMYLFPVAHLLKLNAS